MYKIKVQIENEDTGEILLDTDYPIYPDSTEMLEMDILKFQEIIAKDIEKQEDLKREEDEDTDEDCIGHDPNPNADADRQWDQR